MTVNRSDAGINSAGSSPLANSEAKPRNSSNVPLFSAADTAKDANSIKAGEISGNMGRIQGGITILSAAETQAILENPTEEGRDKLIASNIAESVVNDGKELLRKEEESAQKRKAENG